MIAQEPKGQLVSTCYVITQQDHGLFMVEDTIYLSYPSHVGPYESVMTFGTVFEARAYIESHVLKGERKIRIAG